MHTSNSKLSMKFAFLPPSTKCQFDDILMILTSDSTFWVCLREVRQNWRGHLDFSERRGGGIGTWAFFAELHICGKNVLAISC